MLEWAPELELRSAEEEDGRGKRTIEEAKERKRETVRLPNKSQSWTDF